MRECVVNRTAVPRPLGAYGRCRLFLPKPHLDQKNSSTVQLSSKLLRQPDKRQLAMFDTVCTIPLSHELFTQTVHPTEPIVAAGLASGHVYSYRLPAGASDDDDGDATLASECGFGQIEQTWHTRRHKGSCRTLAYSHDGAQLFSAGTDGIVKAADTATGKVTAKIAIPLDPSSNRLDHPSLLHALSPQSLLLGTDSSALHIYDLRALGPKASPKPQQTHHPHDDYISSLTPLPPTSESTSGLSKQWVSTGGTTLAVTDLRRGVMVRSEDQEEELLSSVIVTGLPSRGTSVGEKVLIGGSTVSPTIGSLCDHRALTH
jgi:WD40 repeat protein